MPLSTIYGDEPRVVGSTSQPLIPQTLHPDVAGYIARLKANGYAPSLQEINAVNNLVYKFVGSGIYDSFQVIYPVIGNSATTSTLDLKNLCNGTAFNSWTFAATGMRSNQTTAPIPYIDTGYSPFVRANQNNLHMSVYNRTSGGGLAILMGCQYTVAPGQNLYINPSTSGTVFSNANDAGGMAPVGITNSSGLWLACRTTSANQQLFINGRLRASNTAASISLSTLNYNIYMGCINRNGNRNFPSLQEIAFASIGASLDSVGASIMYNAVQAYETELGRQV
jgi:hypothetical protein